MAWDAEKMNDSSYSIFQSAPTTQENTREDLGDFSIFRTKSDQSYGRGLLRSIGQGASLGWSDEITAAIVAGVAAMTGEDFNDVYRDVVNFEREGLEDFQRTNPKTALAAEVGGGLLTGGAVRAPVKAGIGMGAAYGAGAAEEDTLLEAGKGAALGGTLVVGAKALQAGASNLMNTRAGKLIKKAINDAGLTLDQAKARLRELGTNARLVDIAPSLGEDLAQIPAARPLFEQFLETRAGGQVPRLLSSLKHLSGSTKQYYDNLDELFALRKQAADQDYSAAFELGLKLDDTTVAKIESFAKAFPNVWKNASRISSLEGKSLFIDGAKKNGVNVSALGLEEVDAFLRAGRDEINTAFRSGNSGLATKAKEVWKQIDEFAKSNNALYRDAKSKWAGKTAAIEAQAEGRKILSKDFELSLKDIAKMGESEKEAYVIGAVRAIRDKMLMTNPGNNTVKAFKPVLKEKLRPAFPDDDSYNAFIKVMDNEDWFMDVRNQVLSNSRTAKRLEGARGITEKIEAGATIAGGTRQILRNIMTMHKDKFTDQAARDIAEVLVEEGTDPVRLGKILKNYVDPATADKIITSITGGVLAGVNNGIQ